MAVATAMQVLQGVRAFANMIALVRMHVQLHVRVKRGMLGLE
jgi:hypothetical protein